MNRTTYTCRRGREDAKCEASGGRCWGVGINAAKKNAAPLGAAVIATLNHIAVSLYQTLFMQEWGETLSRQAAERRGAECVAEAEAVSSSESLV
jgi:hypothetical protein